MAVGVYPCPFSPGGIGAGCKVMMSLSSGGFQMYCSPFPMNTASWWTHREQGSAVSLVARAYIHYSKHRRNTIYIKANIAAEANSFLRYSFIHVRLQYLKFPREAVKYRGS